MYQSFRAIQNEYRKSKLLSGTDSIQNTKRLHEIVKSQEAELDKTVQDWIDNESDDFGECGVSGLETNQYFISIWFQNNPKNLLNDQIRNYVKSFENTMTDNPSKIFETIVKFIDHQNGFFTRVKNKCPYSLINYPVINPEESIKFHLSFGDIGLLCTEVLEKKEVNYEQ